MGQPGGGVWIRYVERVPLRLHQAPVSRRRAVWPYRSIRTDVMVEKVNQETVRMNYTGWIADWLDRREVPPASTCGVRRYQDPARIPYSKHEDLFGNFL